MKNSIIIALALLTFGSIAYAATPPLTTSQGGTGWGTFTSNTLLTGNGTGKIATTTIGSGLSLSGGVLTASGGSGTVSTSTNETAGYLPYWTSTSATPALLGKVATTSITFSGFPANIPAGYGKLVGGSDTTFTYWGLSTTSQPASSNLLTSNGTAGVYGTATSTLNASSPLTGSFTQVGSGGSLGCTIASAGVAGCLNNTDWSTFNGKQAALSTPTWPIQLSGTTLSFGWATTSQPSSSNLWVSNGSNGFYGVGTSTLSASSPLTGSFTQVGSGGTLGCQTASGSQAGCLASADFNTFNGKQATISATWPITLSGAAVGFNGLSTSSPISAASGLLYATGVNTLASVSTSSAVSMSITGSSGSVANSITFNSSGGAAAGQTYNGSSAVTIDYHTVGAQIAGSYESPLTFTAPLLRSSNTISWFGLATTSQPVSSNLLVSNGTNGVYGVATSTLTPTSPLGGSLTVIGSGNSLTCSTCATFAFPWSAFSTYNATSTLLQLNGFISTASSTISSGLFSTQNATTTQFTTGGTNLYVDSAGRIKAKDTTTGFSGVLSPLHNLSLGTGTTTTWQGTTTSPYTPFATAPFTGTLQNVSCSTNTSGVLGVDIYIGATHLPYFIASTTVGTITFSSSNTFTAGQNIYMDAGATTTSIAKSITCTLRATETY